VSVLRCCPGGGGHGAATAVVFEGLPSGDGGEGRRLERHVLALLTEESSLRLRFAGSLGYQRLLAMAEDAAVQRVVVEAELAELFRMIEEGDQ
jgi:hypothetical protein